MGVHFYTGRTSFVRPKQGMLELATGSGCFVRYNGFPVFVTARHNLTGRHWTSNRAMHSTGRCPHSISINVPIVENLPHSGRFGFKEAIIDLEQDDRQVWNETRCQKGICDVGCIIFDDVWEQALIDRWKTQHSIEGQFRIGSINDEEEWSETIKREHTIGSPAFVLGYPLGLSAGGPNRPIWRGSTIATEPRADFDEWPTFLLDVAGRNGLSGAPVVVRNELGALTFSGIYSGRVLPEEKNSDLGLVWKCSLLDELIRSAFLARSKHD